MRLHPPAVLVGAAIALAIAVPAAIGAQVLDAHDSIDDNTLWQLLLVGVILVGLGVGGHQAAVRRLDAPLPNGAAAAVAAYVVVQVVAVVRLVTADDDVEWLSIPFFVLVAAACGVAGGLVADHLARRPRR